MYIFKNRKRSGNRAQRQKADESVLIDIFGYASPQRINFGSEQNRPVTLCVIQRLDPQPVANQEQRMIFYPSACIVKSECEHSAKAPHQSVDPPLLVSM